KSSYLASDTKLATMPASMTIDSSVWLLGENGTIQKFTKGLQDSFAVKRYTQPISKTSLLYTDVDFESLYILDLTNKKIIVVNKDGTYKRQFDVKEFGDLISFSVDEKNKKMFVATEKTVFSFEF